MNLPPIEEGYEWVPVSNKGVNLPPIEDGYEWVPVDSGKRRTGAPSAQPSVNYDRGFLGDVASRLARGGVQALKGVGGALRMSDLDPEADTGAVASFGKKVTNFADEATQKYDILKPDTGEVQQKEGFVKRGFLGGVESTPASLVPVVGGAVTGAALGSVIPGIGTTIGAIVGGGVTLFGTFGLGEYQNTYDETKKTLLQKGYDLNKAKDLAHDHALTSAIAETGGEAVGDIAGAVVFKAVLKSAVKDGIKQTIKQLIGAGGAKEFAKNLAKSMPFEVGSEVGTAYVQAKSAKKTGISDIPETEAMAEAILPAAFMSLMFGASVRGLQRLQARNLYDNLNGQDPNSRAKAAITVAQRIEDAESKRTWMNTANQYIKEGKPIPLDKPIIDFAIQKADQESSKDDTGTEPPPGGNIPPGGQTFNTFDDFTNAYTEGATEEELKGKRDEYSKRPDADPNVLSDVDGLLSAIKEQDVDNRINELKALVETGGITQDELIPAAGKLLEAYPNESEKIKSAFPNVPFTLKDAIKKTESVTPFSEESDKLNENIINNIAVLKSNDNILSQTERDELFDFTKGEQNGQVQTETEIEAEPPSAVTVTGPPVTEAAPAPTKAEAKATPAKEPWQMTREEVRLRKAYLDKEAFDADTAWRQLSTSSPRDIPGRTAEDKKLVFNQRLQEAKRRKESAEKSAIEDKSYLLHRSLVQQALSEGKPVPPEVLKDYPDLAPKKAEGKTTKPEAKTAPKAEGKATTAQTVTYRYHRPFLKGMEDGAMMFALAKKGEVVSARHMAIKAGLSQAKEIEAFVKGFELAYNEKYMGLWKEQKNLLNQAIRNGEVAPDGWKFENGFATEFEKAPDVTESTKVKQKAEAKVIPTTKTAEKNVTTPKEQKKYLLEKIDEALKDAPDVPVEMPYRNTRHARSDDYAKWEKEDRQTFNEYKDKFGTVVIEVPNDGTFTILNTKTSLENFKKQTSKFPASVIKGAELKTPMPTKRETGKRLELEGVSYYNDFKPRKQDIIPSEDDKHNRYVDGYFTQGHYLVKTERPRGIKINEEKPTPDVHKVIPKDEDLITAEIVAEYNYGGGERETAKVHIVAKDGTEYAVNAHYVDVMLTKHPNATVSVKKDTAIPPIVFKDGKDVVGVVMPVKDEIPSAEFIAEYRGEVATPETKFQRGPKSTGLAQSKVQTVINKALDSIPNAPKVNVVQSNQNCPEEVQAIMEREGIDDAMGFTYNGEVYLVSDNIRNSEEVLRTLAHELTHSGLGKFFQRQTKGKIMTVRVKYEALMDSIYRAHSKEIEQLAKTTHTHLNMRTVQGRRQASEEWLCNQTYEAQPKWYDKLVAIFHDLLRAIGLDVKLSDAEVRVVLQDAFKEFGGEGVSFMTAWHGSPHDFDKFSKDKIGTGEGAQAYGYGLYFAGKKEVADYYKKTLAKKTIDGLPLDEFLDTRPKLSTIYDALRMLKERNPNATIEDANKFYADQKPYRDTMSAIDALYTYETVENAKRMRPDIAYRIDELLEEGRLKVEKGHLYEVELAPEEDEYLLWDKPLSEQSEKVKAAINNIHHSNYMNAFSQQDVQHYLESQKGADLYQDLSATRGVRLNEQSKGAIRNEPDDKWASDYLHSLGIRGIKYLDGTSRGKGEGDYNYVIFSDDDIEVTAKFERRGLKDSQKSANIQDGWNTLPIDDTIRNHWKKKVEEQYERDRDTGKDTIAGGRVANDSRNIGDEQLSLPSGTELGRLLEQQIQKTRGKADSRWLESAVLDLSIRDTTEFRVANQYFSSFGYTVIPIGKVEWLGLVNHTDKIALVSHLTGDSFSYFMSHEISHILSNQGNTAIAAIKKNLNTQHSDFVTINDILGMGEEFTREEIASSLVGGWDRYKHLLTGKDSNKHIQDARKAVIDSTTNEAETKFTRREKEAVDEASEPTPPEFDLGAYESKRKEIDDYVKRLRRSLEFPEAVMLARDLMGGKFPGIKAIVRSAFGNSAFGKFIPQGEGNILLKASIFSDIETASKTLAHEIGHLVDYLPNHLMTRGNILGRIASLNRYMKNYLEEFKGAPGLLTDEDRKRLQKEAREQVKSEEKPDEVIVEEIIKEIPQYEYTGITPEIILDLMKGRIEGKVAPELYEYLQRAETKEKKQIVLKAMKDMVDERVAQFGSKKQVGTETVRETVERVIPGVKYDQQTIYKRFKELLQKEVDKRVLYRREVITDELKKLTKLWSPFDDSVNSSYRKYRWSSKELYADAFSVFINYPELMQREAPTFYKAFLSWIESKPQVKETYDAYQALANDREAVLERREKYYYEMYKKGDDKDSEIIRQVEEENKISPKKVIRELYKGFIDKKVATVEAIRILRRAGKKDTADSLEYLKSEMNYLTAEQAAYADEASVRVMSDMKKLGFTEADLGYLAALMRTSTQRRDVANPGGMGGFFSDEQIDHLKNKLGAERFNALKGLLEKYTDLRQEFVIPKLEEARMYSEALMETMKNERNYFTFDVIKFHNKMYGGAAEGSLGQVYHTIGTFQDIKNPFIATIMKDLALMRAAEITKYKKELYKIFSENDELREVYHVEKAQWDWNTKSFKQHKDPNIGLVVYLQNGKIEGFYISKEIADDFKHKPIEAIHTLRVFNALMMVIKAMLVNRSPIWMIGNVFKDYMTTAQNIPGATVTNLLPYYRKAFVDAWKEVRRGEKVDVVQAMKRGKMLVIDRQYSLSESTDDSEFDKLYARFGHHTDIERSVFTKPLIAAWDLLGDLGKVSERAGKIAGYRWLKENTNMSDRYIGHAVRNRIGTPDSYRQGSWQLLINNFFLYFNIGKEGFRSSWESFQENRGEYVWKLVKYNIMPKAVLALAALGAFGDDAEDIIKRISNYDKANYLVIPFNKDEKGKAWYLRIPQSHMGQFWGAIMWDIFNLEFKQALQSFSSGQPFSVNPLIKETLNWGLYAMEVNPQDWYRGQNVVNRTEWDAGEPYRVFEMSKHTWNSLGGSLLYKPQKGQDTKAVWEKLSQFPGLNILGRLLKQSDQGINEAYYKAGEKVKQDAALKHMNKDEALSKRKRIINIIKDNDKRYREGYIDSKLHSRMKEKYQSMLKEN